MDIGFYCYLVQGITCYIGLGLITIVLLDIVSDFEYELFVPVKPMGQTLMLAWPGVALIALIFGLLRLIAYLLRGLATAIRWCRRLINSVGIGLTIWWILSFTGSIMWSGSLCAWVWATVGLLCCTSYTPYSEAVKPDEPMEDWKPVRVVLFWPAYLLTAVGLRLWNLVVKHWPRPTALEKSIAHWHRLATGTEGLDELVGANDCALCAVYRRPIQTGEYRDTFCCKGCPVNKATGLHNCLGSPYVEVWNAVKHHGYSTAEFRKAAAKELAFLKTLRRYE